MAHMVGAAGAMTAIEYDPQLAARAAANCAHATNVQVLQGDGSVTPFALLLSDDLATLDHWDWLWLSALVLLPGTVGHGLMAWAHAHVDVTIGSPIVQVRVGQDARDHTRDAVRAALVELSEAPV